MSNSIKSVLFICGLILSGCQQQASAPVQKNDLSQTSTQEPSLKTEKSMPKKSLTYQGTIQYFELEGGFYGIITQQGKKLLPMNLDKQYQQNGAVIEFSGHKKDVMTIQQWGTPFTIEEIKIIKTGSRALKSEI